MLFCSIGDLPIELPHLEDEDEMYKLGLLEESIPPVNMNVRGRSRSLDLDDCCFSKTKFQTGRRKTRAPHLRESRRAFTLGMAVCILHYA